MAATILVTGGTGLLGRGIGNNAPQHVRIHAAGIASVDFVESHYAESLESNIVGTFNVTSACRRRTPPMALSLEQGLIAMKTSLLLVAQQASQ